MTRTVERRESRDASEAMSLTFIGATAAPPWTERPAGSGLARPPRVVACGRQAPQQLSVPRPVGAPVFVGVIRVQRTGCSREAFGDGKILIWTHCKHPRTNTEAACPWGHPGVLQASARVTFGGICIDCVT